MELTLIRSVKYDDRIIGNLVTPKFTLSTLELPWVCNARNISCIPVGRYRISHRWSQKYGDHVLIENVPNRSMILIHAGNLPSQTRGCVLVGTGLADINDDDKPEVINSRVALRKLVDMLPKDEENILEVKNV